jgi:hypothetical protein
VYGEAPLAEQLTDLAGASRRDWEGRPYPGLAWRPHDLRDAVIGGLFLVLVLGFVVGDAPIWVTVFFGAHAAYFLLLRFFHDAYLRSRISYRLADHALEIWIDGETAPRCSFRIALLADVRPQFVRPSGHGTIELPPGGWATQPRWINNWDRLIPAAYPCRRLELVPDAEGVAEMLRSRARIAKRTGARC